MCFNFIWRSYCCTCSPLFSESVISSGFRTALRNLPSVCSYAAVTLYCWKSAQKHFSYPKNQAHQPQRKSWPMTAQFQWQRSPQCRERARKLGKRRRTSSDARILSRSRSRFRFWIDWGFSGTQSPEEGTVVQCAWGKDFLFKHWGSQVNIYISHPKAKNSKTFRLLHTRNTMLVLDLFL